MMKKTILLLLAAFGGCVAAAAQDLILKTDRTSIEAKVTEISSDEIRYKRFSNPEGPTYVLPRDEVASIEYANGEKEYFGAVTEAVPAPAPVAVDREYVIGEYYSVGGVEGIVCALDEDRRHGLILSKEEIYLPWSVFRKTDLRTVGADDRRDGAANMAIVARYIADHGLAWDDFPAFKWCRDKGEGWYLPSVDELLLIGHNYNGGSRVQNNRQARIRFNDMLKAHGGERMDRMVYYFSSTEMDEKAAFTTHMGIEPPYVIEIPKYNKFLVRAVRRF